MNNLTATLVGAGLCCLVPLLSFLAGVYYARRGLPFVFQWKGFGETLPED